MPVCCAGVGMFVRLGVLSVSTTKILSTSDVSIPRDTIVSHRASVNKEIQKTENICKMKGPWARDVVWLRGRKKVAGREGERERETPLTATSCLIL